MRLALIPTAIVCFVLPAQGEQIKPSLCKSDEEVLFACKSGPTKIISVCASPDATATSGQLVYRFGRTGHAPSLSYPKVPTRPQDAFAFAQACSAKGCTEQLAFSVGEFRYTVYSEHFGGTADPAMVAGVSVERAGYEVADIRCTDPVAPMDMDRIGPARLSGSHALGFTTGEPRMASPRMNGGRVHP